MTIGRRMQRTRKKRGLTLGQLEERSRINRGTLSKIENGVTADPRTSMLVRIATALNTTPNKLLGWPSKKKRNRQKGNADRKTYGCKEARKDIDFLSGNHDSKRKDREAEERANQHTGKHGEKCSACYNYWLTKQAMNQ